MSHHDLDGSPPVRVHLRRSAQARRLSLRVSRLDGKVTLTLPRSVARAAAIRFAEERALWIRGHLAEIGAPEAVGEGTLLPVAGQICRVVRGPRSALSRETAEVVVARRAGSVPGTVAGLLKAAARDRLTAAADAYAARLGQSYARIALRDTRSRWGSCSDSGTLSFSWRLAMAPPEVLDYVAAHEVAHLAHMDHSARFWGALARLSPDYEAPRRWLRENGQDLHRFQFRQTE